MFIDTHAHLDADRFASDRDQVIARAREAGVQRIITCGSDLASSRASLALHRQYEGVLTTVGVHPHAASTICPQSAVDPAALAELAELAERSGVVAIGEIGLDYHYDFSPREAQREALSAQLRLAAERDLPVVLHCREADDDLIALVDGASRNLRGVLHCFMGSTRLACWALDRGLYLGIAGPITFARMTALVEAVQAAPLDRLLIETDCPFLAPHPMRGRRNEPAFVVHVAECLAQVQGLSLEALAAATTANARELFRVD